MHQHHRRSCEAQLWSGKNFINQFVSEASAWKPALRETLPCFAEGKWDYPLQGYRLQKNINYSLTIPSAIPKNCESTQSSWRRRWWPCILKPIFSTEDTKAISGNKLRNDAWGGKETAQQTPKSKKKTFLLESSGRTRDPLGFKTPISLKFLLMLILSSEHGTSICKHLALKPESDSMCGERRNSACILKNKKGNDTNNMITLSDGYVR